jgi:hypothetical protein
MAAAAAANQAPSDRLQSYPVQTPSYQPWQQSPQHSEGAQQHAPGQSLPPPQSHVLQSQHHGGGAQHEARRIALSEIARGPDVEQQARLRPTDFLFLKTLGTGTSGSLRQSVGSRL